MTGVATGRCLCGAVRFEVRGPLSAAHACHCGMCRRQSGHFVVGTEAKRSDLVLTEEASLRWFRSSPEVRRGFCGDCGSNLFWDAGGEEIGLNVGCLDQPTGLTLGKHIFVEEKADYYEIEDGLPRYVGYDTPL